MVKIGLKVISNDKSFYENFETHYILWKFLNPWYFTEIFKPMVCNEGFETHGILRRFLNSWYLTWVLKDFSWGFLKTSENTFSKDGLAEETATLDKWLNKGFNSG